MTYRVRNIVIAVVLAALAALMTSYYVTNYKRHVQRGESEVSVWVASKDISVGTTGTDAMKLLAEKHVPRRTVVQGAITKPDELEKLVATQPVYAGEQVTTNRFSAPTEVGIRGKLHDNVRALEVNGNANQLLLGTLRAGDHVDVVGTFKYKAQGTNGDTYVATRTVLRDLEVLRAPSGSAASKLSGTNGGYAVMLAVTDSQANKLWFTATNASSNSSGGTPVGWSLDLRSPVDSKDSPESVETIGSILKDGLRPGQLESLFGKFGGQ
jgi:Flp pilus assembly protein CpaB